MATKTVGTMTYGIDASKKSPTGSTRTTNKVTAAVVGSIKVTGSTTTVQKTLQAKLGSGGSAKTVCSLHRAKTKIGSTGHHGDQEGAPIYKNWKGASSTGGTTVSNTLDNDQTSIKVYWRATGGSSATFGWTSFKTLNFPPLRTYTVTYAPGSGSGRKYSQTKYHGQTLTVKGCSFSKTGFHFDYWKGSNGRNSNKGSSYTANANCTMTAQWEENKYYVKYHGNKGSGSTKIEGSVPNQTCLYNNSYKYQAINFSRKGYTVKPYWYTKAKGGSKRTPGASFSKLTSSNGETINLYAQWTPNKYTITYHTNNANGVEGSPYGTTVYGNVAKFTNNSDSMSNTATFDSNYTMLNKNNLKSLQRYDFLYWSTGVTSGITYNSGSLYGKFTQTTGLNFYAKWKDLYSPPKFKDKDPLANNVYRCDVTGVQNDAQTYVHINPITIIPTKIRDIYYDTDVKITYRLYGSSDTPSFIYGNSTPLKEAESQTPDLTITNVSLSVDYAYEFFITITGRETDYSAASDPITFSTIVPAGSFPIDVRSDQQMTSFQSIAPSIKQGVALGRALPTQERELYLDINTSYSQDEIFFTKAATLGDISNYLNPSLSADAAMEFRDDGNLVSFGKQIPNKATNSNYSGIILNNSSNTHSDIYFDLNNSSIDQSLIAQYNSTCFDKLTYSNAIKPVNSNTENNNDNIASGVSFNKEKNLVIFGTDIGSPRCAGHNLPTTYYELEWLQSSGTQYINTGVIYSSQTSAEVDFKFINYTANTEQEVLAAYESSTDRMQCGITNANVFLDNGGFGYDSSLLTDRVLAKGVGKGNGTLPLFLFAQNETSSAPVHITGTKRVYSCKIKQNNNWVRYFVPAKRKSDNVLGMYDIINGTFYTNAGSGTFTGGPAVVDSGWLIPKGNINNLNIPESRDVFLQDEDLETQIFDLFQDEGMFNEYGTFTLVRSTGQTDFGYDSEMTWSQWINSAYNTEKFKINNGSEIWNSTLTMGELCNLSTLESVNSNNKIENGSYYFNSDGSVTFEVWINDSDTKPLYTCKTAGNIPFQSWVSLSVNAYGFITDGTYIYQYDATHVDGKIQTTTVTDEDGNTETIEEFIPGHWLYTYNYLCNTNNINDKVSALAVPQGKKYYLKTQTTKVEDGTEGGEEGSNEG